MTFQWGNRWFKGARYALLGIALVLTASCSSDRSIIDLKRFVRNMHKSTQPSVEPLPELAPIPAYTYAASSLPNPFSPENVFPKPESDPLEPDSTRPREPLEGFALDALQLTAIMILEGKHQLIVVTPDGVIHQVVEGAYLGQNYGQVTEIDLEGRSVGLAEVIKGADGRWQERTVKLLIESDPLDPDPTRPREPLEGFALDALQLTAIMILEGKHQLIVVTPDGVIHQVVEGAYLGQNYGQVTEIDLEGRSVGLAEVIKGADGRWQERTVKYLIESDPLDPDSTRPREPLEGFALDALQLTAIMILEGKHQLIVVTPDGVIHQVVEGAYLGQNYGQVTEIDLEGRNVGLAEVIKGADGRWQERTVKYLIESDPLDPDSTRPREPLEGFALDALQLTAIMILEGKHQLIVVTPDGVIHQVVEGAYLGQNYGQVTEIDLEGRSVGLAEVIKGADGRWQERTVKLLIESDPLDPDPTRPREPLEGFALDALQLAAIMILEGKLQLIVVTPDGVIHQVVEGAYLGQNYGQVTEIDLEGRSVGLAEVIQGADGRWQERTVKYLIEPDLLEPDPTRPREHLEGFALDALQLTAIWHLPARKPLAAVSVWLPVPAPLANATILPKEGKLQLIVVTPDGVIHQVVEGAYLGQNYGQVTEIDLEGRSVGLAEVIQGADGRWQERTVKYLIEPDLLEPDPTRPREHLEGFALDALQLAAIMILEGKLQLIVVTPDGVIHQVVEGAYLGQNYGQVTEIDLEGRSVGLAEVIQGADRRWQERTVKYLIEPDLLEPDPTRPREHLEGFALDALQLAAIMILEGKLQLIVVTPDGVIHQVVEGAYLGQNYGQVTEIDLEGRSVGLAEVIQGADRRWQERTVKYLIEPDLLEPDPTRPREHLEGFALDALQLAAIMILEGKLQLIVVTPDGVIHQVVEGAYLGQNYGQVTEIDLEGRSVGLAEVIQGADRRWQERTVKYLIEPDLLEPDPTRPREHLEGFALDALQLAAIMILEGKLQLIVVTPDGVIHQVVEGAYLGQNYGQVTEIDLEGRSVGLAEVIQGADGRWQERTVKYLIEPDLLEPDPTRPREHLEGFALDALQLAGIMILEGKLQLIVVTPDGVIHKVVEGAYLGQNYGQVTEIDLEGRSVGLAEVIQGADGRWQERTVKYLIGN